jgi:hypothetical protein
MENQNQEQPVKKKVGRKNATDPKIQVSFYIETSTINANGGMDNTKEMCIQYLRENSIEHVASRNTFQ